MISARRISPGRSRATAALGFDGVELHDLYGHPADAVRTLLDENGLVACSRHALLPSIESEIEELAEELRILGTDRLVVAGSRPRQPLPTQTSFRLAFWRLRSEQLTLGLRLGFHNHDGELAVLDDGSSVLGRLLDVASGTALSRARSGLGVVCRSRPVRVARARGRRAPLVHVKDMRRDGGPVHVPLGAGEVDYGWPHGRGGRRGRRVADPGAGRNVRAWIRGGRRLDRGADEALADAAIVARP